MPGIIFAFTSWTDVSLSYISEILLPIIVSRFLRGYRLDTSAAHKSGIFFVTYTDIGLNTQAIFGDVTAVALITLVCTFLIGAVVFSITSLAGKEATTVSLYKGQRQDE